MAIILVRSNWLGLQFSSFLQAWICPYLVITLSLLIVEASLVCADCGGWLKPGPAYYCMYQASSLLMVVLEIDCPLLMALPQKLLAQSQETEIEARSLRDD